MAIYFIGTEYEYQEEEQWVFLTAQWMGIKTLSLNQVINKLRIMSK